MFRWRFTCKINSIDNPSAKTSLNIWNESDNKASELAYNPPTNSTIVKST